MTTHPKTNEKTLQQILELLSGGKWINHNTRIDCLPPRGRVISILAARGVVSQTTGLTVTEQDWRDADYAMLGPRDCLYVMLHYQPRERVPSVHAVFNYGDNTFSYC